MRRYRLSHGLLLPDALIAATAIEYDVTLYTKNVRHFQMIPGLAVVRPYYSRPQPDGFCLHSSRVFSLFLGSSSC
jgi:hypothetical protein